MSEEIKQQLEEEKKELKRLKREERERKQEQKKEFKKIMSDLKTITHSNDIRGAISAFLIANNNDVKMPDLEEGDLFLYKSKKYIVISTKTSGININFENHIKNPKTYIVYIDEDGNRGSIEQNANMTKIMITEYDEDLTKIIVKNKKDIPTNLLVDYIGVIKEKIINFNLNNYDRYYFNTDYDLITVELNDINFLSNAYIELYETIKDSEYTLNRKEEEFVIGHYVRNIVKNITNKQIINNKYGIIQGLTKIEKTNLLNLKSPTNKIFNSCFNTNDYDDTINDTINDSKYQQIFYTPKENGECEYLI